MRDSSFNGSGSLYSNASRRQFLKLLGLAGLSGLSQAWPSVVSGADPKQSDITTLKFYGTATLDIGPQWDRVYQDLGVRVQFYDNGNDTGPVITRMINGTAAKDFHVGGLQGGAESQLARAGKIIPWDLAQLKNWDTVWDWARNIPYARVDGRQYGLPLVINADSMIYLPDKVGKVDSYAYVFDPRLKGKTAMEDAWINSVIFTAIYLKENGLEKVDDPGNLSVEELEAVMRFLIQKKRAGQFRAFWKGWEQGLDLIKSEEVYVMTGWEPIVYAARSLGKNVEYAVPKEGYEGWSNDLILHVSAESDILFRAAHAFANWELAGYYGCILGQQRGYAVANNLSEDFAKREPASCDLAKQSQLLKHVRDKFHSMKGSIYWQNVRPTNYKAYERWWSKLRVA